MSEHQVSVNDVKRNPGEGSPSEMIAELMGLIVACGLMIGAIIGVMVIQIGFRDGFQGSNDILVGAFAGGAIGAIVSFIGVRLAESMVERSSR